MRARVPQLCLLFSMTLSGVIIDRIAIVVNNAIIKDSDIDRNMRVTAYLNRDKLASSMASRKQAADRLIDQAFIRNEIDIGGYPIATLQQADQQLARLKRERYHSNAIYDASLHSYGTSEPDLRSEFQWQLTVLRFVEVRFRPGAVVTDDEIQKYFDQHGAELRKSNPGKTTPDDFRQEITNVLQGEKVNTQFFAWLDEKRKDAKIQYREEGLE